MYIQLILHFSNIFISLPRGELNDYLLYLIIVYATTKELLNNTSCYKLQFGYAICSAVTNNKNSIENYLMYNGELLRKQIYFKRVFTVLNVYYYGP